MLTNVLLLVVNTYRFIFKNKYDIIKYLVLPLIGIISAITISNISYNSLMNIGVLDRDQGKISQDMVEWLNTYNKFKLNYIIEDDLENSLKSGNIDCIIVIPKRFTESVYIGHIGQIEVISLKGKESTAWIENYINIYLESLDIIIKASGISENNFESQYKNFTNPKIVIRKKLLKDQTRNKSITQKSIGFLMIFIMLEASIIFDSILDEKKNRAFYRIYASPVTIKTYLLSKGLVSFILILFQIIIVLIAIVYVFHIELYMPLYMVFLLLLSFAVTTINFWIMLVSFVKESFQASILKILIIIPTSMLGGCFWPISIMPKYMQRVAEFIPQKWVTICLERYQEGMGISEYALSISVLMLFSATFFLIARYMFKNHTSLHGFI